MALKLEALQVLSDIPPVNIPVEEATETPVNKTAWLADVMAWVASFAMHAVGLVVLGTITLLTPIDQVSTLLTSSIVEPDETPPETFRVDDEFTLEVGALASGGFGDAAGAAPIDALVQEVSLDIAALADIGEIPAIELPTETITTPDVKSNVIVKGVGAVGTTGSSGAVDRLTGEILLSLEQAPTLVVWLFDRSASLREQREEIVDRFDRVYRELGVIESAHAPQFEDHEDQPLLTSVAAFGQDIEFFGDEPSIDVEGLKESIEEIKEDDSGEENVFHAIVETAQRFRKYRNRKPRRNVLLVVVTDESGDDLHRLDDAVDICRKLRMPVYVVGTPSPFGRQEAFVRYVDPDPKYDQTPQYLPVRQGPESLYPERLKLGSIGRGDFNGPTLDSGFGPYALTRLANETGGFYIAVHPFRVESGRANRSAGGNMVSRIDYFFDQRVMRRYRPDYVPTREYEKRLSQNQARSALVRAATLTWTTPLGNIRRDFPVRSEAEFANDLSQAQRAAAMIEPQLSDIVATLRRGERDRDKLETPRWQAGYDLAMGRALAAKVRAEGYNATLAAAKGGLNFKNPKNDTWVLRSVDKITTGSNTQKEAEDAINYLTRVVEEHEGTPWAYLAQRELSQPLGWEWQEEFRNLVARAERQRNNNNNRPRNRPERPEPPRRPPPKL